MQYYNQTCTRISALKMQKFLTEHKSESIKISFVRSQRIYYKLNIVHNFLKDLLTIFHPFFSECMNGNH